jgi:ethanolamine ammonia-lyase large subunit
MNADSLRQLLVLSNRYKEGDLAVGGTSDEQTATEARKELASLSVGALTRTRLVEDGVSEALERSLDRSISREISSLSLDELRNILLGDSASSWVAANRDGLSSETVAAVTKIMTDGELSIVARHLFNPLTRLDSQDIEIGSRQHFGSRIQPNSPGDDETEILFSILEGLTFGCGDVILGLNPASDDVETIVRLEDLLRSVIDRMHLPSRYCVLSDLIKQTSAASRTRVDVGFQSLAGTSSALAGMVGLDFQGLAELTEAFDGLYFETGQGSEITNGAAAGVDMVTLESRCYGLARAIAAHSVRNASRKKWMIGNDVAGFIGPEVFSTEEQLKRACLEDTVMAKLHGITMGLDVCSTFHMGIEPSALRRITAEIVEQAAPAYLMAVAGNADPMLGYMTTSVRDHPGLRSRAGKKIATAMDRRLSEMGVSQEWREASRRVDLLLDLYASYERGGGDKRSVEQLRDAGRTKLGELQARGFDLGFDDSAEAVEECERRMNNIYQHARRALVAKLDRTVLLNSSPSYLVVRTEARTREVFLAHPTVGERIRKDDEGLVSALYQSRKPQVQIVISDGLNANSVNENLRGLLPVLRKLIEENGCSVGTTDIAIQNGRVRAGYHVGALLDIEVVVHLIGERPGTGLDMLSAYLTYGREKTGAPRWSPELDHSRTTAICGIHRLGKSPMVAAEEIARVVRRMLEERRSGVELGSASSQ